MLLTRHQIRSARRDRPLPPCARGASGDALLDAVCLRFALTPDVRWSAVAEARARLAAAGAPSAEALAGMLVARCGR